ncbi:protein phosphatase 1 regulatory subunit 35 [Emydura macquarii macquarii]|uniref:protein phosphatase 1 regulatory subunit 35 n=1 Tax=Emydura macquarii macquarii TaxID=1129001 RepID=UPI00352ABC23
MTTRRDAGLRTRPVVPVGAAILGSERGRRSPRGRRHLGLRTRPRCSSARCVAGGGGPNRRPRRAIALRSAASGGTSLATPGDDAVPAAPPPAPLPPAVRARPAPDLALSPAGGRAGGILRRRGARERPARGQVRFLLGPGADEAPPQPEPRGQKAEARPGLGGDRPCPSSLAAPELHTCLARAEEARAAAQQGFDARRATRELLATSFVARCSVEGRAAAGMNILREQPLYQGLVSLQVPAEEVLSSALQEKLALVRTQPEPRRELDPEGPDLLMFYEPPELFAETPYLGVEGLPPLRLQPHGRPPAATFLMFRKLQQWDA